MSSSLDYCRYQKPSAGLLSSRKECSKNCMCKARQKPVLRNSLGIIRAMLHIECRKPFEESPTKDDARVKFDSSQNAR